MAKRLIGVREYLQKTLLVGNNIITRNEMVLDSGFARSTLLDTLNKMIREGVIIRKDQVRATAGRRKAYFMAADSLAILDDYFV